MGYPNSWHIKETKDFKLTAFGAKESVSPAVPTASAGHSATSHQTQSDTSSSHGTKHGVFSFTDGIVECVLIVLL